MDGNSCKALVNCFTPNVTHSHVHACAPIDSVKDQDQVEKIISSDGVTEKAMGRGSWKFSDKPRFTVCD
jgi:hypothetical protein